jgi:TldD protein
MERLSQGVKNFFDGPMEKLNLSYGPFIQVTRYIDRIITYTIFSESPFKVEKDHKERTYILMESMNTEDGIIPKALDTIETSEVNDSIKNAIPYVKSHTQKDLFKTRYMLGNESNKKVYLGQKYLDDPEEHETSIQQKLESAVASIDKYKDILLNDIRIIYQVGKYKRDIQDSRNNHITKEDLTSSLGVLVEARRKGSDFTGGAVLEYQGGLDILENLEDLIDQAVNNLSKKIKIEAKPAPKDIENILMNGYVASVFVHEVLGHLLEGDAILDYNSPFKNKYKRKIGPSFLTIRDVPYIEDGFGNCIYDDEGVQGKEVTLIKDGVFCGIMTTRQIAAELRRQGFDVELTGNGRASAQYSKPMARMRNTIMEPGSKTEKELINKLNSGIYLTATSGGKLDPYTGDFVIEINEAYLVENGQLKYPVDLTEIKGNVMTYLENMVDIGSESTVGTYSDLCGKTVYLSKYFPILGTATSRVPVSCSAPSILFLRRRRRSIYEFLNKFWDNK